MNRDCILPAKILTGICAFALSSFGQTYTVSAKPGALNFIQGEVTINGDPVWKANLKSTFLNAGDVLAVDNGKVEVLLNPGVFLRVGAHSEVRMIKPSLIETQVEVVSGESMIEVDDLVPGSTIAVMDHGSSTTLTKAGLFRFTETSVASLDGKADLAFGTRKLTVTKGKEVSINDSLHASKLDLNQPDDLYAWSNTRALTNAAATYAGSTSVSNAGGYGFSTYNSPGWYWASGFNSYMWLPGNGAFYSPFGWGFYGPGAVAYAPVSAVPYGYGYGNGYYPVQTIAGTSTPVKAPTTTGAPAKTTATQMIVPLNPRNVGVSNFTGSSPASLMQARNVSQTYANFYGLQTANGSTPASLRGGQSFSSMQAAYHAAASSSHEAASAHYSQGGGWSGGSSSAGPSISASSSSGMSARSSGGSMSSSMSHPSGGRSK